MPSSIPRFTGALLVVLLVGGFALLGGAGAAVAQSDEAGPVDIVEVEGLIDPPMARYITARITAAERDGAQALVLRLDTPTSVGVDGDALVRRVASSRAPVVAWVAPRDAVALGLGAEIAGAAAAHYAVGEAPALADLLRELDGTTFPDRSAGMASAGPLETWDEERGFPGVLLRFQEMPLWDRLLHAVTTPDVALFLVLLGIFGLVFETYNPGIGIAALLGVVLLALGLYALDILPTNWLALLLIVAAIAALIYDVHIAGFGIWTVGGVAALALGAAWLFPGADPALELSWWAIPAAVALTLVFFVSVMTAALRVRLRRPIEESGGVVGAIGEAQTDIAPEGTVLTNGTLWRARTMETGIAAGARVEVKATEGLVLLVEPLHED